MVDFWTLDEDYLLDTLLRTHPSQSLMRISKLMRKRGYPTRTADSIRHRLLRLDRDSLKTFKTHKHDRVRTTIFTSDEVRQLILLLDAEEDI